MITTAAMSEVSSQRVIKAVYDLHSATSSWPTPKEIAAHLLVGETEVRDHLRDLKAKRLLRERTRQARKVWMPWSEA